MEQGTGILEAIDSDIRILPCKYRCYIIFIRKIKMRIFYYKIYFALQIFSTTNLTN